MRKGFTEENSKEMEVVLKIRVPVSFDEMMESRIDEALADTLFQLGCELVNSREYSDLGEEFERPRSVHFSMDDMRAMIREEVVTNGVSIYGMTGEEVDVMRVDAESIDVLAEYMDKAMFQFDGNEYRALEFVFEQNFVDVLDAFREKLKGWSVDGLGLFYDASIHGSTLFVDCWQGDSVEIFLADDGGLMCLLPDEDEPRALRENIQDVEPGDAFLFGGGGSIRTASEAAHQNFDEPDNPWILYGDDGEVYFEDDIGSELGRKVRALLEKLPARNEPHAEKPSLNDRIQSAAQSAAGLSAADKSVNFPERTCFYDRS